jgi:hypothetical protein
MKSWFTALGASWVLGSAFLLAQEAAPARSQIAGTIAAIDGVRLSVRTDKGETVPVLLNDKTVLLRIPPGETDVRKGAKIAAAELNAGDRIVAVGQKTEEAVQARSILVMTRADVAQVQKRSREEWQKRGAAGTVIAVDSAAGAITLKAGPRTIVVNTSAKTTFFRYSPESAKFADSKPGTIAEVAVGDQARVLGDRDAGGAFQAEKVVSGSFRQIAATVVSVDSANGQLQVKDLATKKPLTIRITPETAMRKLPPEVAAMLARRYQTHRADEAQAAPGAPAAALPEQMRGGRGTGEASRTGEPSRTEMRGGGDIGQMLDRLPAMPLAELKAGDAILASTTTGSHSGPVTATMMLAGVEALLTASPDAARDVMSGWNLGESGDDIP